MVTTNFNCQSWASRVADMWTSYFKTHTNMPSRKWNSTIIKAGYDSLIIQKVWQIYGHQISTFTETCLAEMNAIITKPTHDSIVIQILISIVPPNQFFVHTTQTIPLLYPRLEMWWDNQNILPNAHLHYRRHQLAMGANFLFR